MHAGFLLERVLAPRSHISTCPRAVWALGVWGVDLCVGAAVAALHAVRLIPVLLVLPLAVRVLVASGLTQPPSP